METPANASAKTIVFCSLLNLALRVCANEKKFPENTKITPMQIADK
jgi:hypothetical protein